MASSILINALSRTWPFCAGRRAKKNWKEEGRSRKFGTRGDVCSYV